MTTKVQGNEQKATKDLSDLSTAPDVQLQLTLNLGDPSLTLPAVDFRLDSNPPALDPLARQALQYLLQKTEGNVSSKETLANLIKPKPLNETVEYRTSELLTMMDNASHARPRNADSSPVVIEEQIAGSRPIYNGSCGQDELIQKMQELADAPVFMPAFKLPQEISGKTSSYFSLDLHYPELAEARKNAVQALAGAKILLPYLAEPETAHLNYAYALEFEKPENIFAISARSEPVTEWMIRNQIPETTQIIKQQEILACVNWEKVCEIVNIPFHADDAGKILPPAGTKGLTVLAGLLYLHAQNQLRTNPKILISDTDFVYPKHNDGIAYLGIPLAYQMDNYSPEMIMLAKTGAGRNNEQWIKSIDALANDRTLPLHLRQIVLYASTYVWPLAGNRMIHGEHCYRMPIATAMGFETMINLYMAANQIEQDQQIICQVANPGPVIENGYVDAVREHAHIDRCAQFAKNLIRTCHQESARPNTLSLDVIKEFNRLYGSPYFMLIQADTHSGNKATGYQRDYILPSIEQMIELKVIDFQKIKQISL